MTLQRKRAIVIGASSGMGEACARRFAEEGYRVALVGRRETELKRICDEINQAETAGQNGARRAIARPLDVTRYQEVPKAFDEIVTELGGLDLFVYAAGVMPEVGKDEYNFAKDRQIMETNFLGANAWLNEAAQFFQRTQQGTIVGISSVAGDRGRRGNPAYCTSKAALNTFLESLRNRLNGFNVNVVTVKPGFVDTPMTRGKEGLFWLITAQEAARQIAQAVAKRKRTVYVPRRWRAVMTVIRAIPSGIFSKLEI